jgi:hypothetical protein
MILHFAPLPHRPTSITIRRDVGLYDRDHLRRMLKVQHEISRDRRTQQGRTMSTPASASLPPASVDPADIVLPPTQPIEITAVVAAPSAAI